MNHEEYVPSWGTDKVLEKTIPTVSNELVNLLARLGVDKAFGVIGGALAPFSRALSESSIAFVHCRHESGAAFAASEASLASGKPSVVFVTTGPGLANAINGMLAARWDGAQVILISAGTSPEQRGKWAAQETSGHTMPISGLFTSGPLFHFATTMENPVELPEVARRITVGLAQKGGFIAHINLPINVQTAPALALSLNPQRVSSPAHHAEDISACVQMLMEGRFAIWVGFGARHAARELLEFAELTGAAVMSSPRAKGIFPESHPQYLGVTGLGGNAEVLDYLAANRPLYTIVLGSRLGESTSYWSRQFVPEKAFVHVDVDPSVFGAAYPSETSYGIQAEIKLFMRDLLKAWPRQKKEVWPAQVRVIDPSQPQNFTEESVRPAALMSAVQRVIVEGSDAVVMAESGNAFAWATNRLSFDEPHRYRVSPHYGSMGHVAAGVLGAALGGDRCAVALVGDGSMLMLNELNTAVQHQARAMWVILNDSQYGMCAQGMSSMGWKPFGMDIPQVDFASFANSLSAKGLVVNHESELDAALRWGLEQNGPCVIDVRIDRTCKAPAVKRNQNLMKQGAITYGRRKTDKKS